MRIPVAFLLVLCASSPAMAGMSVSFAWGPTTKCFDKNSPPITLKGVPEGTAKLDIRMQDLNAMNYNHGGAKIDYSGQSSLAYGAFRYKGPCPPSTHTYRFTVKALDAKGKVLDKAEAKRKFP